MPEGRLDSITRTFALDAARTEPVILTKGPCCRVKVTKYASPGGAFPVRLRVNGPTADPWTIPGPVNIAFDEPVTDVYFENDASAGGVVEFSLDPAGGTGFEINPSSNFSVPSNFALLNVAQDWTAKQNFTVGIDVSDGTAGNPEGVAFKSEPLLGIYRPFAGGLGIAQGGLGRVVADFSALPFAFRPFAGQVVDLGLAGAEWGKGRFNDQLLVAGAASPLVSSVTTGILAATLRAPLSDTMVQVSDNIVNVWYLGTRSSNQGVLNAGGGVAVPTGPLVVGVDPGGNLLVRAGGDIHLGHAGSVRAQLNSTDAALDAKKWRIYSTTAGQFVLDALNDAESSASTALTATRSGPNFAGIVIGADPGGTSTLRVGNDGQIYAKATTAGESRLTLEATGSNHARLIGTPSGSGVFILNANLLGSEFLFQVNALNKMTLDAAALAPAAAAGLTLGTGALPWGPLFLGGGIGTVIDTTKTTASAGIEHGRTDGVASTPYIDFHSGTTGANDYDSRIIASGGGASLGLGSLQMLAAGVIVGTDPGGTNILRVGGSISLTANLSGGTTLPIYTSSNLRWTIDASGGLVGDDTNGGLLVISQNVAAGLNDYIRFRRQSAQKVVQFLNAQDNICIGFGASPLDTYTFQIPTSGAGFTQKSSLGATLNVLDVTSGAAGEMGMKIWDNDAATSKRVTHGAADSGGVGFKLLRVPN